MNHDDKTSDIQQDVFDLWLNNFFLDPQTTFLDQSEFRIDLFETNRDIIVEAFLTNHFAKQSIGVYVENAELIIIARNDKNIKKRTIRFPFQLINKQVTAYFKDGILEVFINKETNMKGKNRFVDIH